MRRTLATLMIVFIAGASGWWLRGVVERAPLAGAARGEDGAGVERSVALPPAEAPLAPPSRTPIEPNGPDALDPVAMLKNGASVAAALDRLDALERRLPPAEHAAIAARVVDLARAWSEAGELGAALALAESYADRWIHDTSVRFLLSDLYQMSGRVEPALRVLHEVLAYPVRDADAALARDRIRLLERTHAQSLAQRRELEALVGFYEWLITLDPQNDGYRLAAAEWLVELGARERALAFLREVGTDVDGRAARLTELVELRDAGVSLRQDGDRLLADVIVDGTPLVLLVDTGATTTSLEPAVLERLGASRMRERVQVSTAAGVVAVPTFRVRGLQVGRLEVPSHEVLALPGDVSGADGLLGMDLLRRAGLREVSEVLGAGELEGATGRRSGAPLVDNSDATR